MRGQDPEGAERMDMDPPQVQSIDVSSSKSLPMEDEQDKVVDECCSCWYDCTDTCFDYLFCDLC